MTAVETGGCPHAAIREVLNCRISTIAKKGYGVSIHNTKSVHAQQLKKATREAYDQRFHCFSSSLLRERFCNMIQCLCFVPSIKSNEQQSWKCQLVNENEHVLLHLTLVSFDIWTTQHTQHNILYWFPMIFMLWYIWTITFYIHESKKY